MSYKILVASYTSSIYTLSFDPKNGTLEVVSETEVGFQPSWLDFVSSESGRKVVGVLEQEEGVVFIADVGESTGKVDILARAKAGGDSPCHVIAVDNGDGKELVIANVCVLHPFITLYLTNE